MNTDIQITTTTTTRDGFTRTAIVLGAQDSFDLVDRDGNLIATINTYSTPAEPDKSDSVSEIGIDVIPNGTHVRARAWKGVKQILDFHHKGNGVIGVTFEVHARD